LGWIDWIRVNSKIILSLKPKFTLSEVEGESDFYFLLNCVAMPSQTIDSIIFDLDGTLWDAALTCTKAWNEALKELSFEHALEDNFIRSVSGLKIEKIFELHLPFVPNEQHAALINLYRKYEGNYMKQLGGNLFPAMKEVLTELSKSYKQFIVSNCSGGYIENFLEFHGLQNLFVDFESSGNTGLSKTENIQLIITRNNAQSPVYIGDTSWDNEAAIAANIPFIYAAYGFGKVDDTKYRINEIAELPGLLMSLAKI
jgi:phosphoglycolate phosphatase